MTSSLVGSEMCIRDSLRRLRNQVTSTPYGRHTQGNEHPARVAQEAANNLATEQWAPYAEPIPNPGQYKLIHD
eukprot:6801268-Prorocentrum_lima.AAC.1